MLLSSLLNIFYVTKGSNYS